MFIKDKGGDPDAIRESEKKRYHKVEVIDEVIALYEDWVKRACCYIRLQLAWTHLVRLGGLDISWQSGGEQNTSSWGSSAKVSMLFKRRSRRRRRSVIYVPLYC